MKHHYLLLVLLTCLQLSAAAQILDQANTAPLPGETFDMMSDAYVDPGAAGEAQTWDYSFLSAGFAYTEVYVSPDETDYAGSFPTAEVVQDILQGWFLGYHTTSAGGMDFNGYAFTSPEEVVVFEEAERIVPFPCSYGSTWSGSLNSTYTNPYVVVLAGTYTGEADGSGTLVMPYGTINNVLRVVMHEDYTKEVEEQGLLVDHHATRHLFLVPEVHRPVLMISHELIISGTDTIVEESTDWISNIALGEAAAGPSFIGIELYPNPAADQTAVVFTGLEGVQRLDVIDPTGRILLTERLNSAIGIQRHDLDVGVLPPGIYQIRITHASGGQGTKRLVVR